MKITSPHIEQLAKERQDHLTNARLIQEEIDAAKLAIIEEEYGLEVGSVVTDSKGSVWKISTFVNFYGDVMCDGFKHLKGGTFGINSHRLWDFNPVKQ